MNTEQRTRNYELFINFQMALNKRKIGIIEYMKAVFIAFFAAKVYSSNMIPQNK